MNIFDSTLLMEYNAEELNKTVVIQIPLKTFSDYF